MFTLYLYLDPALRLRIFSIRKMLRIHESASDSPWVYFYITFYQNSFRTPTLRYHYNFKKYFLFLDRIVRGL